MEMTERQLQTIVERAVTKAIAERDRRRGRVWVNAKELRKQYGMITEDWLKRYGWKLPRERIDFTGDDGKVHSTQWGYDVGEIERMFEDGRMRKL